MRRLHLPVAILSALALALPLASAAAAPAAAAATPTPAAPTDSIYLCVDADGHKSYQNSAEGASCRRVDGVLESIPSSDLDRRRAHPTAVRPVITPASFPRVDVNTQRTRDSDRRRILQDELRAEQEHLVRLRTEFNQGRPEPANGELVGSSRYLEHVQHLYDDIERAESNVASLQRELTPARY